MLKAFNGLVNSSNELLKSLNVFSASSNEKLKMFNGYVRQR